MRYLLGFVCMLALAVAGCSETAGAGGSGGTAGRGGAGGDGGAGGIPECQEPEDCNDREECTTDACVSGICENMAVEEGIACDESNECAVGQCASGTCESTPVTNGTACGDDAGTCQDGSCEVACTEQGIRDAIAAGGGPYTFDCADGMTVVTQAEIEIDNDVILDGEGNLTVDGNEDHHVLSVDDGVTAELRGFTVTNGVDDPNISGAGGIRTSGTLTLINSTISGNTGGWAGGIGNAGSLTLNNSTVSDNTGVGILNFGTLALNNSTVSGNDGTGIAGAGDTTLINSTVSGNSDTSGAGGIHACDPPPSFSCGPVTLVNSTVSGNSAGDAGGGIYGGDPLTLRNSTVSGNTAKNGGGIIFGIDAMLINSTVSGNTATEDGGGILATESLTLMNSTVSGNTAGGKGAAIFGQDAPLTLVNSTVVGDVHSTDLVALKASGTVIQGACSEDGSGGAPQTSLGYNIESPGYTCGFNETGDLFNITEGQLDLGELANNGGPTMTHALGADSVAIDHIPAVDCGVTTDQRGEPRPETGGDACDVGSFERQPEDP